MDADTTQNIAQAFLDGSFETLQSTLSEEWTFEIQNVGDVDESKLAETLNEHPVSVFGTVDDAGGIALLWPTPAAIHMSDVTASGERGGKEELDETDVEHLHQIGQAFMDAGIQRLANAVEGDWVSLTDINVKTSGADAVSHILNAVGGGTRLITFRFSAGGVHSGTAAMVFGDALESACAGATDSESRVADLAREAHVSDEEMSEILSGFDAGEEEEENSNGQTRPSPENLEMILDIKLDVTARLGTVELPIGEVLNLGPGSILEVGHLVDEPVELLVNDKLIARGDVVVVDEKFGLRITEILSTRERLESLR